MTTRAAEFWIGAPSEESNLRLLAGGPEWPDYFMAELREPGLDCRTRVAARDPSGVSKFSAVFQEMADSWKGWDGEKVWQSPEGELELRFTMSAVGSITVMVMLRDPYSWAVTTELGSESGDTLTQLARDAAAFQAALDGAA
jgi:hypothetical protein